MAVHGHAANTPFVSWHQSLLCFGTGQLVTRKKSWGDDTQSRDTSRPIQDTTRCHNQTWSIGFRYTRVSSSARTPPRSPPSPSQQNPEVLTAFFHLLENGVQEPHIPAKLFVEESFLPQLSFQKKKFPWVGPSESCIVHLLLA